MIYLTRRYEQFICMVISIYVTSYLVDNISPCLLGASSIGLPEGKQSRMPDSTLAVEQYSKLHAPVAR